LKKLFQVLQYRNRESELVRICEEQSKLGFDSNFLRYLIALDGGRIDDAINNLERVEFQAETVSSVFMMQKGLVFKLAGKKGWKEMIERARVLSSGTVKDLEAIAAQQLQVGFIGESHQSLRGALLRSEVVPLPGDYSGIDDVIAGLSAGAATLRNWREALAYREVAALTSSYAGVTGGIFLMRDRFQILVAQGALAMEEGNITGAVTAFSEAHRILPRDGYLANELFPVLREVGLIELHDQLFAQSAEYAREVIRRFPKDDNAYNNFAWLASRANRCLEEAEAYLMKALKMKPQSAAYLDTMGEIYFARKDREKALKWSALSIKNEVLGRATNRWELHQQRRRFQSGGFPVR
jgi:tetratricopeptide (TPR) repeat protein